MTNILYYNQGSDFYALRTGKYALIFQKYSKNMRQKLKIWHSL